MFSQLLLRNCMYLCIRSLLVQAHTYSLYMQIARERKSVDVEELC